MREICPICKTRKLIPASGPADSPILVFGWAPGKMEIVKGIPWLGKAGNVLEAEFLRHGIQRHNYRLTNLWMHEAADKGTKKTPNPLYAKELDWHFLQLKNEIKGRKAVLIMGSEPMELFGLPNVSEISGTFVQSVFLPSSVDVAMAMVNPAQALHDLLGETRYAINKFALALQTHHITPV